MLTELWCYGVDKSCKGRKLKAIRYICHIHTNSIHEYVKCKLDILNIGCGGGSEDIVCLYRWTDRHADRSYQVSM